MPVQAKDQIQCQWQMTITAVRRPLLVPSSVTGKCPRMFIASVSYSYVWSEVLKHNFRFASALLLPSLESQPHEKYGNLYSLRYDGTLNRETAAYNAPVEVHVDAPPLDLTIKPESPITIVIGSLKTSASMFLSSPVEQSSSCHSSLVDTSTQTVNITDVSVNPVITSTSIVYPRSLLVGQCGSSQSSSDVGIQVEISDNNKNSKDDMVHKQFVCDKSRFTESSI